MKNQYSLWSQYLNTVFKYCLIAICMWTMQGTLLGVDTAEETRRHAEDAKRAAEEARRAADEAKRAPVYVAPAPAPYYRPYGYRYGYRGYPYYRRHHRGFFGFGW
jgi:hypothetical protein